MKILYEEISNCGDCPYCHYDGYYSMGKDSGWDCLHENSPNENRIINEGPISNRNKLPEEPPKWCPLPDKE